MPFLRRISHHSPERVDGIHGGEHAPGRGGTFIQAESEIAAINMVLGASAAGARAMTSSSSPGISLKQEGISALAADELPAVIVNMMRGGPGLGNILPLSGRLLPGHPRRRSRGLPHDRAGPRLRPGAGRSDHGRLRPGRQVPQPRHDPGRRDDGPDDGARRVRQTQTPALQRKDTSSRVPARARANSSGHSS